MISGSFKKILAFTFFMACVYLCQSQSSLLSKPQSDIPEISYEELFEKIQADEHTLYLVNFWATWCKPCVEELPEFMKVNEYCASNPHFKMYLISMDFAKNKNSLVVPFLAKNDIKAEVLLLNDNKRMNTWIPLVDESWSGAIPATVFFRGGKNIHFTEGKMTKEALIEIINKNL